MEQPNAAAMWLLGLAAGIAIGCSMAINKSDDNENNCSKKPLPIAEIKTDKGANNASRWLAKYRMAQRNQMKA